MFAYVGACVLVRVCVGACALVRVLGCVCTCAFAFTRVCDLRVIPLDLTKLCPKLIACSITLITFFGHLFIASSRSNFQLVKNVGRGAQTQTQTNFLNEVNRDCFLWLKLVSNGSTSSFLFQMVPLLHSFFLSVTSLFLFSWFVCLFDCFCLHFRK